MDRNRARRLLREVFRRSGGELKLLEQRYDWVINAKSQLLGANEELRFREFRKIVEQVTRDEREGDRGNSPTVKKGSKPGEMSPR